MLKARVDVECWHGDIQPGRIMLPIVDGYSEIGANVGSNLNYLHQLKAFD